MLDVDFTRKVRNKAIAREEVRNDVLAWYMAMTGGIPPKQQCEVKKPHDSELHWYLEPLIPGVINPLVIEQERLDGQWSIRIDPIEPQIRVFCK